MATTYDSSLAREQASGSGSSVFSRIMNSMVEARQREANRLVLQHLRSMHPDTLRSAGYTEDRINEIFGKSAR